ncbi:hypothetical protein H634G_07667 [Metarhizium anisopliae BRIP 53293]|uniref:Uncharacterized protein n=1 Tax=Metarhizium anisopliae BRIP 53293 TaxID=1291518 RepID=A0A0D9NTF0_METAN|nr:hypothetical protein H634G_07667 [Metarhizium anisopliae BRIP 53293]KJK90303.1 hypothetical protein H633G_05833 [Metarhizium anisopliae BRIP 53284]
MKPSLVASTVFIATGLAEFVPVNFTTPLNWLASQDLMNRKTCEDLSAPYKNFTAETWAAHVLNACQSTNCGCTSALGFSMPLQLRGSGDRQWYGQMFSGNSTTEDDYVRQEVIQDSIAYTLRQDK